MKKKLLLALVEYTKNTHELSQELTQYNWDNTSEHIELKLLHIINICNLFVAKEIDKYELENWANLVEGREDLNYEQRNDSVVRELIFDLANPDITVPITLSYIESIILKYRYLI